MSDAAAARIRSALEPVLTAAGFDIEDVVVRPAGRRSLVQVVVDRDGGVTLDDVAEASRACSSALDAAELAEATPDAYVLEVTSPGTDRPLTEPRHWRRNTGRLVEVRRRGAGALTGRLLAVDDDGVTVETKGAAQSVPFADITKGVVQLEFSRAEQEARA